MPNFFNKYPYTDFHELNLDWILETVKNVVEEWAATLTAWGETQQAWHDEQEAFQDLHDYVMNYFNNLDVQAEINVKLDQMAADGTLDALLLPYFNQYKTEINNIIAGQNSRITILESRMDTFSSLAEGSTTGDAELMDARIGVDGVTYPSAGDAIRAQIINLQHGTNAEEIAMTFNTGYIRQSDGAILTDRTDYNYSDIFQIQKGHLYRIHAISSVSVAILSKWVSNVYNKTLIKGDGVTDYYYYFANDDMDVRLCSANSTNTLPIDRILIYDVNPATMFDTAMVPINTYLKLSDGLVQASGYVSPDSRYCVSDVVTLKAGVLYYLHAIGTSGCSIISDWTGGSYQGNILLGDALTYDHLYRPSMDIDVRISSANETNTTFQINRKEIILYSIPAYQDMISNDVLKGKTINVIGDSYVEGNTLGPSSTWHYMMAAANNMIYNNYGINGNCLIDPDHGNGVDVLDRYTSMTNNADYVIVIGGKNDYNYQYPIASFKAGLENLCKGLVTKYPGKKIAFFTPWYVPQQTLDDLGNPGAIHLTEYCDAIEEVCKVYSIAVFNGNQSGIYAFDAAFRSAYFQGPNDASHLNAAGSALFEHRAETFVRSL